MRDNFFEGKDEEIFPVLGSFISLPSSDWHVYRWNLAKDITDPETEDEKLAWDKYFLTEGQRADDF